MSYAEDICEQSLRLVLRSGTEITRNYRPDSLRNPTTGRKLELDFYIPSLRVALEIQGPHHYEDEKQRHRDEVKRQLLKDQNIQLVELTIFQISPSRIHAKLRKTRAKKCLIRFNRHRTDWKRLQRKYQNYRINMQATYDTNYFRPPR